MLNKIYRKFLKRHLLRTDRIAYSRFLGVKIGVDCRLIGLPNWGSEPWLISIGDHSEISFDVAFITHDGATWVLRNEPKYQNIVRFGRIIIGNNCFIGAKSIIMPGVVIGDNSIIGAGSVVTKSVPTGQIWAGVPAKFISYTTDYAEKCLKYNPVYDLNNYKSNFKDEVLKMTDKLN